MSLGITGTGTEIGKTVTSAVVLARYGGAFPLRYWKPVATGSVEGRDSEIVAALTGGPVLAERFLFAPPVSPHLAAREAGVKIELATMVDGYADLMAQGGEVVVEGVGGLLVPLDDAGTLLADLFARLELPLVVVAASGLGTINHTLLTLEAIRARGLECRAVILNGPRHAENRRVIERLGRVPVLELEPLAPLTRATVAAAAARFDPEGVLAPALQPAPPSPAAWIAADRAHVWHPYTQAATAPPPLPVVRAHGVFLELADGRQVVDGISSWWVNIHGHSHPRLNRALAAQAERFAQIVYAGCAHEPGARLAAELVRRAPGALPRVFYSDDGSTAVEVALKIAYQHWRHRGEPQRTLFVAFDDAYHGDTFGAMAAGGVEVFHRVFRDLFCAVRRAQTPDSAGRPGASPPLAEVLAAEGDKVAAVILEPILQGAGGMRIQPPAFLREVRALTEQHGVPLIADEVLTGFGRTGPFFACAHGPIAPDLLCVSKALTGGYLPLSATLATEPLYASFLSSDRGRAFFHGHSYTGNALACAVALESLALLDEGGLARVTQLEQLFARRLAALVGHPRVAACRGIGGIAAVELAVGPDEEPGYLAELGPRLAAALLDRGLLVRPLGNVLYLMPPYVITDEEAEHAFDLIEEVITSG